MWFENNISSHSGSGLGLISRNNRGPEIRPQLTVKIRPQTIYLELLNICLSRERRELMARTLKRTAELECSCKPLIWHKNQDIHGKCVYMCMFIRKIWVDQLKRSTPSFINAM